jgi:hypothetical protein
MSNSIENIRKIQAGLEAIVPINNASLKIDAVLRNHRQPAEPGRLQRRGRLMFCLDLTASREAALCQARIATATMFDAINGAGSIAVKLAYFRGESECRMSGWHDDLNVVSRWMRRLSCETGNTQIARLLRMVLDEGDRVSGIVYVGDHTEDSAADLETLARRLGENSIPIYLFHEYSFFDRRSVKAQPIFKLMAECSHGVYVQFRADSGAVLRELLTNVAAFAASGSEGVRKMALPVTAEARQLRGRLLLGSGE